MWLKDKSDIVSFCTFLLRLLERLSKSCQQLQELMFKLSGFSSKKAQTPVIHDLNCSNSIKTAHQLTSELSFEGQLSNSQGKPTLFESWPKTSALLSDWSNKSASSAYWVSGWRLIGRKRTAYFFPCLARSTGLVLPCSALQHFSPVRYSKIALGGIVS